MQQVSDTKVQVGQNTELQKEFNLYEMNDDTPACVRLRNQIRQNQSIEQFREVKLELLKSIKNEKDTLKIIIDEKLKRAYQNINGDKFRGSKYRGVSKNKNKWQMMIMINQKKVYIGAIQDEIDAAKYYDHIAIISQGLSAKTNFKYNVGQISQIVKDYDIDVVGSNGYESGYNSLANSNDQYRIRNVVLEGSLNQRSANNSYLERMQGQSFRRQAENQEYGSTDENQMISSQLFKITTLNSQKNAAGQLNDSQMQINQPMTAGTVNLGSNQQMSTASDSQGNQYNTILNQLQRFHQLRELDSMINQNNLQLRVPGATEASANGSIGANPQRPVGTNVLPARIPHQLQQAVLNNAGSTHGA